MGDNRMIKKLKYLAFVVLLLTIVISGCTTLKKEETIKIGAVLPLTGEGTPDQGQASQKAIMLALDEINAQGGINGKNIEAIFEDSQCQAQNGVTAITKLINVNKVNFIIGDICDSVTGAIMPIAEENEVVLITPGSTSPVISDVGDYIFRFWFSENDLGGIVAETAYNMDKNRMAILYINNAWGAAQKDGVKKRFEELGGEIVSEQVVDPNSVDYRTELLKAEKNEPDAYYIGLHPNGLVLSMKRLRELGINKTVFSHGGLVGSTQTLGMGGDFLEGIIAPFVYNPKSTFRDKFVEKFNEEPGITADSSYDAVHVVAKIMMETGKTDSETIKEGLYKIRNYDGASGSISVDEKGDVHRPLRLLVVNEGKLLPYSE